MGIFDWNASLTRSDHGPGIPVIGFTCNCLVMPRNDLRLSTEDSDGENNIKPSFDNTVLMLTLGG